MLLKLLFPLWGVIFFVIGFLYCQTIPKIKPKDIVEIQLLPVADKFSINGEIVILVKFSIHDKYHIYHPAEKKGIPTTIKVNLPDTLALIKILYPAPILRNYPKIGGALKLYEKEIFVATVLKAVKEGNYTIDYIIDYGACTDSTCLEPQQIQLSTDIEVNLKDQSEGVKAELMEIYNRLKNVQIAGADGDTTNIVYKLSFLLDNRILQFLAYFLIGIISALTPCILPVLPITIGWFQTISGKHILKYISLTSIYILSSSVIFGVLGLAANTTGGFIGAHLGNFYVVLGLSTFFIILSYWVMGAFEIPSLNISGYFRGNIFTSILFGSLTGIILSPCIGPILLWLLAHVARSGSKSYSFFALFFYAIGLNLPLIIGAISLSFLKKIARNLTIATFTKIFFSILILFTIIYFSWANFVKMYGYLAIITVVLGVLIKKYISYIFKGIPDVINQLTSKTNTATFIIFLVFTIAFMGRVAFINDTDRLFNKISIEEGIIKAKEENKPLLVKFWAQWCPVCLEQKYTLFNDPEVIKKLEKFYLVEVDCTTDEKKYCQNKFQQLGASGLPVIALYDKNGILKHLIEGPIEKYKFIKILDTLQGN